ncbi:MAG: hypothetical protein ACOC3V_00470 [bacterium]
MKKENIIEIKEDVEIIQDDKKIILEKGDKIEILKERAPLVGSLVGKKIIEVRDLSESHGYVKLLFSDNSAIHMNDWDWYSY